MERSSAPISVDRRDFLRLSVATGVATVLGCSKTPEPDSAPPGEPPSVSDAAPDNSVPIVDAVADQAVALGNDLQKIFRFVQDEIRYEPYAGALRGAKGTIAGRTGNSADQSLLLAALLDASGIRTRFANGSLADSKVRELRSSAIAERDDAQRHALDAMAAEAGVSRSHPVPAPQAPGPAGDPDRHALEISVIRETANRQFETAIGAIEFALAKAQVNVNPVWSVVPDQERTQHFWVQAQSGSEWIDLDPCFVDSPAGTAHGSVAATYDKLPDEIRHRVEFRAILEIWRGGKLEQTPIFEYTVFVDEALGVPICFTHVKSDELKSVNLLGGVAHGTRYNPVLEIGSKLLIGKTPLVFGAVPGGSSGTGGTLVDALGGGGGPEGPADGEAMAEWLEVNVLSPGEDVKSTARTIFDRAWLHRSEDGILDAAAIQPAELIDLPTATREFLPCRTVIAFSTTGGPMSLLTLAQSPGRTQLGSLAWPAHGFHLVRDALMTEVGLKHGVHTFVDSPSIVSLTIESIAGATTLETMTYFDIWHRSFGALPTPGQQPTHAPLMVAGVLAHVAERCVSLDGYPGSARPQEQSASVGAQFDRAAKQGVAIRVLRGKLPVDLTYSREAKYLIEKYLELGAIVVLPERAGDDQSVMGWWVVNPATGWTFDTLEDGSGSALVEYIVQNAAVALRVTSCLIALTSTLATIYQYVANKLTKVSDLQNEILSWVQMVTGVVGLVSGAGCFSGRWVPRARPPPRLPPDYWYGVNPNRIPKRYGGLGM